jgi:hypothetical protein
MAWLHVAAGDLLRPVMILLIGKRDAGAAKVGVA